MSKKELSRMIDDIKALAKPKRLAIILTPFVLFGLVGLLYLIDWIRSLF